MLNILGLGHAFPETKIDSGVLTEMDPRFSPSGLGIIERRTSVPLTFLKETKNSDVWRTHVEAPVKPTDLSHQSALIALQRAGLEPHQLGLIIGDTSTPFQTTPAEAQKLGKRLDLKVTAYDITASTTALVLHAHTFRAWKDERLPEYILSISGNTPTQSVDYTSGIARELFGDGGAAVIYSSQRLGKLSVIGSYYATSARENARLTVAKYGTIHLDADFVSSFIVPKTRELITRVQKSGRLNRERLWVVAPHYGPAVDQSVASTLDLPAQRVLSNATRQGNHFGSSEFACLSEHWDALTPGDDVLLLSAGVAGASGYLLLHVN